MTNKEAVNKVTKELRISHLADLIRQERAIQGKIAELASLTEEESNKIYFPFDLADDGNWTVRRSHANEGPYDSVETAARLLANELKEKVDYYYPNSVRPGPFITHLE